MRLILTLGFNIQATCNKNAIFLHFIIPKRVTQTKDQKTAFTIHDFAEIAKIRDYSQSSSLVAACDMSITT